ncbi:putative invertase inhibitor [Typha angustifolia]|uniref:putative invertase inhibitor n=1 Tax=Typha angustifolia TaxID=59011 RepID=UPI003C2C5FDD
MHPLPLLLLLFLFLFLHPLSSLANTCLIEDTCKHITAARPNIGYDFCIQSFNSDQESLSADAHRLAVIATRLANSSAVKTESKINELIEAESKPSTKDQLGVCLEVYSDAIDHLGNAARDIEARSYRDAMTFLSAALDAAENCEDAFEEAAAAAPSPLEREDGEYGRLADMALAITASL